MKKRWAGRYASFAFLKKFLTGLVLYRCPPYITKKLMMRKDIRLSIQDTKALRGSHRGLHFTLELLEELAGRGVKIAYVTLHVGLGTFRPVKVENLEEHKMHSEFYRIKEEDCDKINSTKQNGGKIIAVGLQAAECLKRWEMKMVL